MTVKEQGDDISRRLLLKYISQYPGIYPVVKQYVQPSDFGDGLTGQVAAVIYEQMEKKGAVDEAAVLNRFPDTADQTQIAGMFHTLDQASSSTERGKAVRETLLKVFQSSAAASATDLKVVIQRKKQETALRTVKLSL